MNEERRPWEQIDGEPDNWFDRFERFRLLGARRSLEEVWRAEEGGADVVAGGAGAKSNRSAKVSTSKPTAGKPASRRRPPPGWYKAAERWHWRDRAAEWDAELRARDEDKLDAARQTWIAEKIELKTALVSKLRLMLMWPLEQKELDPIEEVGPDGRITKRVITIIRPVGWRLRDVVLLARLADHLMRPTEELPLSESELDAAIERELARISTSGKGAVPPEAPGAEPTDAGA